LQSRDSFCNEKYRKQLDTQGNHPVYYLDR